MDYNKALNRAYLEGLNNRLDKKQIKLGEIKKQITDLSVDESILLSEIKIIQATIEHAQNSDN
tara:strand:- start:23562 stop:23750 length:189 start_codon:yes stop_codon:yes gene_type:complete